MVDMKVMKKVMNKGPVYTFGGNERTFDKITTSALGAI